MYIDSRGYGGVRGAWDKFMVQRNGIWHRVRARDKVMGKEMEQGHEKENGTSTWEREWIKGVGKGMEQRRGKEKGEGQKILDTGMGKGQETRYGTRVWSM